jgi:hypothetical protein
VHHARRGTHRLFEAVMRAPDLRAVPELIALMINLCHSTAAVQVGGN